MQKLDKRQIAHAFSRASASYDDAAVVQQEVLKEHLDRLSITKIEPQRILDLGSGTGMGAAVLAKRYSKSRIIAIDIAHGMLEEHKSRLPRFRNRTSLICADQESLPLPDQSFELIFSNLVLQWSNDIQQMLKELRRIMKVGGLLTFTTVGPDTMKELRDAWSSVEDGPHIHDFMDMHIIGDALISAGFAEPVLDIERYTLTYPDVSLLLKDLKMLGTTNASTDRSRGLLGKKRLRLFEQAYEKKRIDGKLPLTYEIVYGHAWVPAEGSRKQDGSTVDSMVSTFPVSELKRRK